MNITMSAERAMMGNTITVKVTAQGTETIRSVEVELDARTLGHEHFSPPTMLYEETFAEVGLAGPGRRHHLTVTVLDGDNRRQRADKRWRDEI